MTKTELFRNGEKLEINHDSYWNDLHWRNVAYFVLYNPEDQIIEYCAYCKDHYPVIVKDCEYCDFTDRPVNEIQLHNTHMSGFLDWFRESILELMRDINDQRKNFD